MTEEKSFAQYEYKKPLETNKPQWSTDPGAIRWMVGGHTSPDLPAGVYSIAIPYGGTPYLHRLQVKGDKLYNLPNDPSTEVLAHIKEFWDKEEAFRELGVVYKRGILLYGPPGSGKSVTIFRLASEIEKQDAVMLLAKSVHQAETGIEIVRALEPSRKIVVVFEDLDGIIRYGDEEMTHLLDGEVNVDNVLFVATTNYPNRLPPRLLNRPSRFDVVMRIGMPSEEARAFYIKQIVKNLLVDIDELVRATKGLTFAQIKEVIILIQIFDNSIEEAVEKLTSRRIKDTEDDD